MASESEKRPRWPDALTASTRTSWLGEAGEGWPLPMTCDAGRTVSSAPGRDVLSGPFSGCWMAMFTMGGATHVCHVATPECNAKWTEIKEKGEITGVTQFKPAKARIEPQAVNGFFASPHTSPLRWTVVAAR